MKLFGERIKKSNWTRMTILLLLIIVWRWFMKDSLIVAGRDRYLFPTLGLFIVTIALGELTRRFIRFFWTYAPQKMNTFIQPEQLLKLEEQQQDSEALNLAIVWSLAFICYTIF